MSQPFPVYSIRLNQQRWGGCRDGYEVRQDGMKRPMTGRLFLFPQTYGWEVTKLQIMNGPGASKVMYLSNLDI